MRLEPATFRHRLAGDFGTPASFGFVRSIGEWALGHLPLREAFEEVLISKLVWPGRMLAEYLRSRPSKIESKLYPRGTYLQMTKS